MRIVVALLGLALLACSEVTVLPPKPMVRFFDDGTVTVFNPGTAPEIHVSLCVMDKDLNIVLERYDVPILAGHTGVMGPTVCSWCEQRVVYGGICDPRAVVVSTKR